MVSFEDRPITRKWVICDNCGYSEVHITSQGWWGVICDVCGKEGCLECMEHETFWVGNREYHHHKACKLTKKIQKLKDQYNRDIGLSCALVSREPDHIC